MSEKFERIKTESGITYKNVETGELCGQEFKWDSEDVHDGLALVVFGDYDWTYYNPETNTLFSKKYLTHQKVPSLAYHLKNHPEDFENLPTVQFRNKEKIKSYLDAIAKGLKERDIDPSKVVEISDMISKKIEKEKANIKREDREAKKAERAAKKAERAAKKEWKKSSEGKKVKITDRAHKDWEKKI